MPEDATATAARLLLAGTPRLGAVRLGVVDGPSGSGKTTFAAAWASAVAAAGRGTVVTLVDENERAPAPGMRISVLSTDLLATWDDPFDWWGRFDAGVLGPLAAGRAGTLEINDWTGGTPVPGRLLRMAVPDVLILEGVSSARRAVADRVTATVWVEVLDRAERLRRSVARDGEASRRHLQAWQDAEDRHFEQDGTRLRADLTVRTGS